MSGNGEQWAGTGEKGRVRVGAGAVLGANVILTASTPIIDVTGPEEIRFRGYVPPRSIVIPGMRTKRFPAGEYQLPCALIIGQRSAQTDLKTSLNDALRDFEVAVSNVTVLEAQEPGNDGL